MTTLYKRRKGVAGQISVTYAGGETAHDSGGDAYETTPCELVGSTFGGPVVLVTQNGAQMFVRNPERFGRFEDDPIRWAKRFVGLEDN